MSNEQKHTPGPWTFESQKYRPQYRIMGSVHVGEADTIEDAARIVACVNACAGMDDPAKQIPALIASNGTTAALLEEARAINAELVAVLTKIDECNHGKMPARRFASKALAEIKGRAALSKVQS